MLHELLDPRLLRGGRLLKLLALGILVLGVTVSYSRAAWLNLGVGVARDARGAAAAPRRGPAPGRARC